jgi:hypothetical protein
MAVEKLTFEMNAVGNAVPEMKKVQAQLGNVSKSMTMATAGLQKHANANRALVGANKNLTRNLGMASLQFQDMAVQASMGTDALRIMTMQAPQLASVFGPKGMILGAVVAIGGAFAMLGERTTKLTFDFKKFGADMAVAFKPLIDFVMPAVNAVKKAFDLLKTGAMIAINGIINGFNYLVTFISGVPAIVSEAFTRAGKQIQLFATNSKIFFNEMEFTFLVMISNIMEKFLTFTNETAKEINRVFSTALPEDMGAGAFSKLQDKIDNNILGVLDLTRKADGLRAELDKPYQSVTDLKDDLANITQIDLFSYFDRVKVKSKETADAMKDITTVADMVGNQFENAFMSAVKGTKSVKDAFRAMAVEIIGELFRIFVVKQITGFVTSMFTAAFPSIAGVPARANGGPVNANTPYMVGERGPELFVPARSGSIMPNERIKGGGGEVIVQQTINVTTGVQQTVRNEIQTLLPQIAEASKAAVMDARKRGGSFANAF